MGWVRSASKSSSAPPLAGLLEPPDAGDLELKTSEDDDDDDDDDAAAEPPSKAVDAEKKQPAPSAAGLGPWASTAPAVSAATEAAIAAAKAALARPLKGNASSRLKKSLAPVSSKPASGASGAGAATKTFGGPSLDEDLIDAASLTSSRNADHSGLVNRGTSCFLDVVLQMLSHNDEFCSWLQQLM